MFDLTETTEVKKSVDFDPFYTHDDGTHWVHSSLYTDNPEVDCWFTPDALVMWHPGVFEYDHMTPVSPLLKFQTFTPKDPEYTLEQLTGASWVVSPSAPYAEDDPCRYVFVNSWGRPSDCIEHYKRVLSGRLYELGF